MNIYYSDHNSLPLPAGHHFPAEKYKLLRMALLERSIINGDELHQANPASKEIITLAHDEMYYQSIIDGSIDHKIISRIGLPWSRDLVNRSLRSVGGSVMAAVDSLKFSVAGNLGGGTHHAMADRGQGFCIFNDLAVAALFLLTSGQVKKIAILDLDAHQGNGNSSILGKHSEVYILSMHGIKTFPYYKIPSTIDIGLRENIGDEEYLFLLNDALPDMFNFEPDIIFYIAGTDPLKSDRFGKLGLSLAGLEQRDTMVISEIKKRNVPLTVVMGGGYANPISHNVEAHVQTYKILKKYYT